MSKIKKCNEKTDKKEKNKWDQLKEFIEKETNNLLLSDHDLYIYQRISDKMEDLDKLEKYKDIIDEKTRIDLKNSTVIKELLCKIKDDIGFLSVSGNIREYFVNPVPMSELVAYNKPNSIIELKIGNLLINLQCNNRKDFNPFEREVLQKILAILAAEEYLKGSFEENDDFNNTLLDILKRNIKFY